MKVLIGLGNSIPELALTKHNTGFMVIDYIADKENIEMVFDANIDCLIGSKKGLILLKPCGYINNSGIPINKFMKNFNINKEEIIVIHDDIDLPFGDFRFKNGGSSAGHNGLKSIIENIGSDFKRYRIGIGRSDDIVNHVLSKFSDEEKSLIDKTIEKLYKMIKEE